LWCVPARVPTRRADRHAAAVRRMRDARSRRRAARRRERLAEAQLAADAVALRPPPSLIAVHPPVRLRVVARADGSTVFVLSPTSSSSSAPAPAGTLYMVCRVCCVFLVGSFVIFMRSSHVAERPPLLVTFDRASCVSGVLLLF
jgi:hypothetical protein